MGDNQNSSTAELLVNAAVKSVGKREFLKTIEKIFGIKKNTSEKVRHKSNVPADYRCVARMKGDRTGMKVGRYVLFDNMRCERKGINGELCAIHTNQMEKFGALHYGRYDEPITEELQKVFGDI
jgi:hypothetical protein